MKTQKNTWTGSLFLAAAVLALAASWAPAALAQEDCCIDHLACQDGEWCTGIEFCNCWGVCVPGTPPNCNDMNACTTDTCVNDVVFAPGAGYGTGHCEHVNICEPCGDVTDCDDGDDCTIDDCVDERCTHTAVSCDDLEICTDDICDSTTGGCVNTWIPGCCHVDTDCDDGLFCNGVETCDTAVNACLPGTNPCDVGLVCVNAGTCNETTDTCDVEAGWCLIGGVCYANNARNPANECQACLSGTSQTAWSPAPAGWSCTDDGIPCTDDVCDGAGACVHDIWADRCLISGTCWTNGTRNPGAECEACIVASSQTAWSPAPAGWACSGDTITCTADECDGLGACVHPVDPGYCLFGTVCVLHGTSNPIAECEWCDTAASTTAWTDKPVTAPCTDDGHTCTDDHCDGAGLCTHTFTSYSPNDTCSAPDAMSMSGSGLGRYWMSTGDTYCGRDDYSSPCGGAGYPDLVHSFDIPVEYETYRYRVMVGGPAGFNPVESFYTGTAASPACGNAQAYMSCNDNGSATCWSYGGALGNDTNDSCWYNSPSHGGRGFPNGTNYVVVDSIGAGNSYQVKVDRVEENDLSQCDMPLPEIQMGGTWTGRTSDATIDWWTNMPYCMGATATDCMYFNIYHINHTQPPWNTLNRGYVITLDGYDTTGGFNTVGFFAVNACSSPWYLLSCDNDTEHWISGGGNRGTKVSTGPLPAGRLGGFIITGYGCYESGNYTMDVELDDDGDGLPNASDGSTLLYGSRRTVGGADGAKLVPSWPWGDHGYSYHYPRNDNGLGGREVNYYYDNTLSGRTMRVRIFPRVRGDVWGGAGSYLWDGGIWYQVPASQNVYCRGTGWAWRTAGTWYRCDIYGSGSYELVQFSGNTGRYYIAVDSWTSTPRGGWYSLEFY